MAVNHDDMSYVQVLGRCAFVSVKVCYVKGQGRLRFTRDGCTSWSFSFYEVSN